MELLQVVRRCVGSLDVAAATAATTTAERQTAAHSGEASQHVDEHRVRLRKLRLHSEIVDLDKFAWLAVDRKFGRGSRRELLVRVQVFVPEHQVIGGEGLPVRPLQALAQKQRRRAAAVFELPVFGHRRHDLDAREVDVEHLVGGHDPVHVFAVSRTGERPPPSAAVAADLVRGFEHHRFLRQPLINWGQLPALDQLGQHGRFFECLGHGGGVGDDGRALELAHQLTEIGLGRWLRRRRGRLGRRGCRLSRRGCGR